MAITYHVPPDRDADMPALTVLQTILATGESSRLYADLVYRDGLAQDAAANLDAKKGTGNLIVYAIMAGRQGPPRRARHALRPRSRGSATPSRHLPNWPARRTRS